MHPFSLLFSSLLNEKNAEEFVLHLIPVLHLVQENRLHAWQDDVFGEIFLKILEDSQGESVPLGSSAEDEEVLV